MQSTSQPVSVLVLYYSRFGVVEALAEHIVRGADSVVGVAATSLPITESPLDTGLTSDSAGAERRAVILNQMTGADGLIVGAPAYFGSMASPVKRLFEDALVATATAPGPASRAWQAHQFRDKVGAAFTSSGTPHGGNEMALQSILTLFMHLGMLVVTPGQGEPILQNAAAPYGATAISGSSGDQVPTADEFAAAHALGARVADVATWLKVGRMEWQKLHGATCDRT